MSATTVALRYFFSLFQEGIVVRAETGVSVQAFLCEQIGLDPGYVAERISTVFLDGMPVDNLEAAMLHDGAVLALSAAMPGLVGATFRKGGFYAPLRRSISYGEGGAVSVRAEHGNVRVKLFNAIMEEAGPHFLRRGIVLSPSRAAQVSEELAGEMPGLSDGPSGALSPPAGEDSAEGDQELLLIVEIGELEEEKTESAAR